MKRNAPPRPAGRFKGVLEELEPRILFSADAAGVLLPATDLPGAGLDQTIHQLAPASSLSSTSQSSMTTQASETRVELVFVDSRVPEAQALVQLIEQHSQEPGRVLEIHWLSADTDGVDQITQTLNGRHDISAVHLISHGSDGSLTLGQSTLDATSLTSRAADLIQWGTALSGDADILLYGCDVAATELGIQFLNDLSLLTGADVAASTDATGHVNLGGDWTLEWHAGLVDTRTLLSSDLAATWVHILPTVTLQEGLNGYAGTSDTFVYTSFGVGQSVNVGGLAYLNAGDDGFAGDAQTLVKFDLSQIPLGSTINSVTLTVRLTTTSTASTTTFNLQRMLVNWSESSTWNSMGGGISTPGEASSTVDSSIVEDGIGFYTFGNTANLRNTVQGWVNGTSNNYGWYFTNTVNLSRNTFASSEAATSSYRPALTIDYTPPVPPSMDLDADNSTGATGSNFNGGFVENGGAVRVADIDATIGTGTASTLNRMTVTISNLLNGTAESLDATTTGSITKSYNSATGVLTLSGTDTAANYQAVLRSVTYDNTSEAPNATARVINVVVTDSYAQTASGTSTLNVTAINDAPVITSNGGGATANITVAENVTAVTTVTSTDPENTARTYSIVAGGDGARFSINATTGVLTFASAPDYDAPADSNLDNVYVVTVQASDGSLTDTQTLTVTVTALNDNSPIISSNGGGATAAISVAENTTAVTTVTATDADVPSQTLTYSISGGADAALFSINGSTGVLTFVSGRNRESATDANGNHVYEVTIRVSDGTNADTQAISVTVTDVDEFDVGAITDTNAAASTLVENTANGTLVGITANAADADATTNTITYTLSNDAGGRFAINSASGVVTVANGSLLNYEGATSHSITVLATSADGSTSSQSFTINLTDVDEFNVGAITDSNAAANAVAENSANGTVVGLTAFATDADGTNNTVTYTLSNNAGGRFAINSTSGVVTVANGTLLNYETALSYSITVVATSTDGSTASQAFTINLTDVDEFDVGAVTDVNAAANSVAENAANGTVVGVTARATDADRSNNTITYTLSNNAGGRFAINSASGIVTVANGSLLNYEAATSHTITVLATSADGSSSSQSFTINLTDVDEFNVGAITDINATANVVAENVANGTAVGITARASDTDGTTNAITYTLSDNAGGRFAINSSSGVVTVANGTLLNYEAATSHTITVLATSVDGSTSSQNFSISLTDIDEFDVGPITDADAAPNSVTELAANGDAVGITASASDADGTNNTITYTLSDSAGGRFAIDATSGIVTVANPALLDFETSTSHGISVLATSADGSTSTQTFTITITNGNEFGVGAIADTNAGVNTVQENAANGSLVGITANATDADADGSDVVTYSLSDDAAGRFAIDSVTGVITVLDGNRIDREAASSYDITVVATSTDTTTSSRTFTIAVADVNESPISPIIDIDAGSDVVAENALNGSLVGVTAQATDADATNNTITYSLSDSAGGRFAINASTGVVTVADGSMLDFEAAASHVITVLATSADGSTSSQSFTINLSDVDEFNLGPISDANAATNSVLENASNGSTVGITASATDADGTTNTVTYTLTDNAGGRFAIDAASGIVTVANGSLLDFESASSHFITVLTTSADGSSSSQSFTVNMGDADEFNVGPITDVNAAIDQVAENAANGTVVGITASATDADGTTNAITYTLIDSAGGRFAVNASTGVVTVANGSLLNFEATTTHTITVLATSADGSSTSQDFTIGLDDVDEFNVGPVSDVNASVNRVSENAVNGASVGLTAFAVDADGTNGTITYALIDSAGGRFAVDAASGVVTVANGSLLDFEAAASHTIVVMATSADGSSSSQSFTIQVTDVNEFNVGPVSDVNAAVNNVAENAANGSSVGLTAHAVDADGSNNTVTYTLSDSAGGRFAIDSNTGVVTVANGSLLNYEAATSHSITVVATSADGSTSSQSFAIAINDVDEFDVGPITDGNPAANQVAENSGNGTVVGITAQASDADGTNNAITYTLSDDASGRFAIDSLTGVITVADGSLLNHEDTATHSITVVATSADGSTRAQSLTINVTDVNEFNVGPITDADATPDDVAENAAIGTTVGITASAADADGSNNAITYVMDDSAGGRFAIHASTGVITVASSALLDFETSTQHTITVSAISQDGSSRQTTFTINLSAVNDNSPTLTTPAATSVMEGATDVIRVAATDADLPAPTLTYFIAGGGDASQFTIDAGTGQLSFVTAPAFGSPADQDLNNRYEVMVGVSDGLWTQTTPLEVEVTAAPQAPTTPNAPPPPAALPDFGTDLPLPPPAAGNTDDDGVAKPTPMPTEKEPEEERVAPIAAVLTSDGALTDQVRGRLPGQGAYEFENLLVSRQRWSSWVTDGAPTRSAIRPTALLDMGVAPDALPSFTRSFVQINPWSSNLDVTGSSFFFDEAARESGALVLKPAVAAVGGMTLSLGMVWWATRASALVSSLLITTPAWRTLDPLPVFMSNDQSDDDEGPKPVHDEAERMFDEPPEHRHTMQFID